MPKGMGYSKRMPKGKAMGYKTSKRAAPKKQAAGTDKAAVSPRKRLAMGGKY